MLLLERLEKWDDLTQECRRLLERVPDQWTAHERAIRCVIWHGGWDPAVEIPNMSFSEQSAGSAVGRLVPSHQAYLRDLQKSHVALRGPFLAELKLIFEWTIKVASDLPEGWIPAECHLLSLGEEDDVTWRGEVGEPVATQIKILLRNFISRFGSKQCCFSDLRSYVVEFCHRWPCNASHLRKLLCNEVHELRKSIACNSNKSATEAAISTYVNMWQVISALSSDAFLSVTEFCLDFYELLPSLPFDRRQGGTNSSSSESVACSDLLVLLSSALRQIYLWSTSQTIPVPADTQLEYLHVLESECVVFIRALQWCTVAQARES